MAWSHQETKINFHPLLLPLEIFSKPSCFFRIWMVSILPPYLQFKDLLKGKVLPRCERKRVPSDSVTFSLSPSYFCFALLVCFVLLFWVSLVLCIALFNLFLFVFFSVLVYFSFHIKKIEIEKYKNSVCMCTLVLVYLGWLLKQSFLNWASLCTTKQVRFVARVCNE